MSSARTALALLLCVVAPAFAQGAGSIKGQITGDDGDPLFGANVIVQGSALTAPLTVVSDENGMYEAGNLPDGVYDVSASFVGYETATRSNVRISDSGEVNLDFSLAVEVLYGDQIIVSASRRREKVLDAPASVAVVGSDEVQAQRGLSAADYIVGLAGIDNAQTGLFQANTVARGFNNVFSGTLLTLVDNRIARVPSLRFNAHHFIPVTNHDVDRVEVVLGPGAALYGPNSANGVMHIVTRSPYGSEGTSVSVMGGERDLRKLSFRHAATTETVGMKLSGQYFSGTDWEHEDPEEVRLRGRNPRDYDVSRLSGELRLDVRPTDDLTGILSTGFARINSIEMTGIGAGQADGWTNYFLQGRLLFKDVFIQAFHNSSDAGDTKLLRTNDPIVDKSTFTVVQAQHSLSVAERSRITYGADGLFTRPNTEGTINGANESRDNIDEFGVYVQGESDLNEYLTVVAAARYDDHNHIDERVFSPRAAVVLKPDPLQTFRLTYNRAFGTPSAGNFFLDLVQAKDAFGTGSAFAPVLGFSPSFDIRAQGTEEGFTFSRDPGGVPYFRSPFAQVIGLSPSHQIGMNDARFSNVMWGIGRSAVMDAALPSLKQLASAVISGQLAAAGVPAEQIPAIAAQQVEGLAVAFQNLIPQTLPGLRNTLRVLNPTTAAFDPVPDQSGSTIRDIDKIRPTITETYEVGYKGIFGNRLAFAADVYRTRTHDFVAPLRVETPNVFLDPDALGASLSAALAQALQDPSAALLAAALGILDAPEQGGNGNNTPIDEITHLFVAGTNDNGAAFIPFGTVTPLQASDPNAIMLTYRNFGDVDFYGFDASFAYYADDTWTFTGSYSHVNKDLFKNLGGIADVALNAPSNKFTLGATANIQERGVRVGFRLRGRNGFPMISGVYIGDVKSSLVFDTNVRYELPSMITDGTVALVVNASNMFNQKHREFVGAPGNRPPPFRRPDGGLLSDRLLPVSSRGDRPVAPANSTAALPSGFWLRTICNRRGDPCGRPCVIREGPAPFLNKIDKKTVVSWAMYDFANSAFTTLVVTFIYSTYFVKSLASSEIIGTTLWSRGVTFSAIAVALVSPLAGALADRGGYRKSFLLVTTIIAVVATTVLYTATPGQVMKALLWFAIANFAFEMGNVFYNAFLPDIAPREYIGRISGYGWGLGYIGGLLAMGIAMVGFVSAETPWFGFTKEAGANIRATNLLVAVWFAVFSVPIFLWVKEKKVPVTQARGLLAATYRQLARTFGEARKYKEIIKLLIARLVYNDGLITIFAFGGIYAAGTFGFTFTEIMIFGIVLNVAAGIGAFVMGFFDDLLGGKRTIQISLVFLIVATLLAIFTHSKTVFWVSGIMVGFFAGPNQSASRSLPGTICPAGKGERVLRPFRLFGKSHRVSRPPGPRRTHSRLPVPARRGLDCGGVVRGGKRTSEVGGRKRRHPRGRANPLGRTLDRGTRQRRGDNFVVPAKSCYIHGEERVSPAAPPTRSRGAGA